jgi:cyclase
MTFRVIPRLDIKGPNVVKGVHLEGLRVVGKPEAFASLYYLHGADELLYMDVVASLYGRNNILDVVRRTAREVFIPITVGGGIRTLDDIRDVLRAGADKVAINTAAIGNPAFIRDAARRFGSSTIVVSIEAILQPGQGYEAFTENGREATGLDAVEWAVQAVEHGAGEVMVTSVDREGTGKGFDLELTRRISEAVPVPVVAGGGAGRPDDVVIVFRDGGADAASIASILHYEIAAHVSDAGDFVDEGNTEFLRHLRVPAQVHPTSLGALKRHLAEHGVECRPVEEVTSGG